MLEAVHDLEITETDFRIVSELSEQVLNFDVVAMQVEAAFEGKAFSASTYVNAKQPEISTVHD